MAQAAPAIGSRIVAHSRDHATFPVACEARSREATLLSTPSEGAQQTSGYDSPQKVAQKAV